MRIPAVDVLFAFPAAWITLAGDYLRLLE